MPTQTFFNLDEEKRERVIQIALKEFAHNNYQKANLDHIVEMAGVSKGSLYQYFEDKEDLFVFIARESLKRAWNMFQESLEEAAPPDCFTFLYQALLFATELREKEPELALLYLRVGFLQDTYLREKIMPDINQKNTIFLKRFFTWGIKEGLIDPELNQEAASFLIDAASNRFQEKIFFQNNLMASVSSHNLRKREDFLENIISLLRKAFAPKKKNEKEE